MHKNNFFTHHRKVPEFYENNFIGRKSQSKVSWPFNYEALVISLTSSVMVGIRNFNLK